MAWSTRTDAKTLIGARFDFERGAARWATLGHLRFATLAAALMTFWGSPVGAAPLSDVVQTQFGAVRGTRSDVFAFKGVPYAAPPVGNLRWRPPAPLTPWSDVRDATAYGASCPQSAGVMPQARVGAPGPVARSSEDCLTLNVWTPAKSTEEKIPVIVWLHGGGFTVGSASVPEAEGSALARRGVVVVSVEYRLGPLGFLAHPALSQESEHHVSGNYGLLDQIAALQWVRANIAAFGGDPSNVTLVGQSAGATSIGILMVSPLADGLFHRAIIESIGGSFAGPKRRLREPYYGMTSAESDGASRAPDIAAFRAMSADEVLKRLPSAPTIVPGTHYYPIIDGYVLPGDPDSLIARSKRPILIGHNAREGLFWAGAGPKTLVSYGAYVRAWLPLESVPSVLQRYPAANDGEAAAAAIDFTSDFRVAGPTMLVARNLARVTEVHAYRFSRVSPFGQANWGGAAHTAEIPYVFGNVSDPSRYDDADRALSNAISGAWVRFAQTGDPNGPGLPRWPAYKPQDYTLVDYGDVVSLSADANNPAADYFEGVYLRMRSTPKTHRETLNPQ